MSHTWTRLAATAKAGSTKIRLEDRVDWKAGDEIVLATPGRGEEDIKQTEVSEGVSE